GSRVIRRPGKGPRRWRHGPGLRFTTPAGIDYPDGSALEPAWIRNRRKRQGNAGRGIRLLQAWRGVVLQASPDADRLRPGAIVRLQADGPQSGRRVAPHGGE